MFTVQLQLHLLPKSQVSFLSDRSSLEYSTINFVGYEHCTVSIFYRMLYIKIQISQKARAFRML